MAEKIQDTPWGSVQVIYEPDGARNIHLTLDGMEYTLEARLQVHIAYRLGQELVHAALQIGLPEGFRN